MTAGPERNQGAVAVMDRTANIPAVTALAAEQPLVDARPVGAVSLNKDYAYAISPLGVRRDPRLELMFRNGSISPRKYNEMKRLHLEDARRSGHVSADQLRQYENITQTGRPTPEDISPALPGADAAETFESTRESAYDDHIHTLNLLEQAGSYTIVEAEKRRRKEIKPQDERTITINNRTSLSVPLESIGARGKLVDIPARSVDTPTNVAAETAELVLWTSGTDPDNAVKEIVDVMFAADPEGGIIWANVQEELVPIFEQSPMGTVLKTEVLGGRTAVFFKRHDLDSEEVPAPVTDAANKAKPAPLRTRPESIPVPTVQEGLQSYRCSGTGATPAEAAAFLSSNGAWSA